MEPDNSSPKPDAVSNPVLTPTQPEAQPASSQPGLTPAPSQPAQVSPPNPNPDSGPSAFGAGPIQGTVVAGGDSIPSNPVTVTPNTGGKRFLTKKFGIIVVAVVAVLILGGGYVFAFYLPNRPSAVWNTGLDRTGQALDSLITDATTSERLKTVKGYQLSGSFNVDAKRQGKYSGTFGSQSDPKNSDSSLKLDAQHDGKTIHIDAKLLTQLKSDSQFPDIYLKASGLASLGIDYSGIVSQIDNRWLFISGDYLSSLASMYAEGTDAKQSQVNQDDMVELSKTMSRLVSSYVLTSDPAKGILEQRSFVGKEKADGMTVYHYTVGLNKANTKVFCETAANAIGNSAVAKKSMPNAKDRQERVKEFITSCRQSTDKIKPSDIFDLWIDKNYKLIHKVRFTDDTDKATYTEFGQIYKGDHQLNLFVKGYDAPSKQNVEVTLALNLDSLEATGVVKVISTARDDEYNATVNFSIKKSDNAVTLTLPSKNEVLDLRELFQSFTGGLPTDLQ